MLVIDDIEDITYVMIKPVMRCDEDILLVKSEAWDKKYTFPEKILESYGSIGENIKKISSSIYVELEEYDTTKPICILEFLDKKQRS